MTNCNQLICSTCGNHFFGKQEPQHDSGFGTCDDCVDNVIQPKVNEMLDQVVEKLEKSLSPKNLVSFQQKTKSQKRDFAMRCIDNGLISYSFG